MADIDVQGAQTVTPPRAPVGATLSGREQAGVNLTWGVMTILLNVLLPVLTALLGYVFGTTQVANRSDK